MYDTTVLKGMAEAIEHCTNKMHSKLLVLADLPNQAFRIQAARLAFWQEPVGTLRTQHEAGFDGHNDYNSNQTE
jgi:hypothetical protein